MTSLQKQGEYCSRLVAERVCANIGHRIELVSNPEDQPFCVICGLTFTEIREGREP
jgi:hypothetical protein